MLDCLGYNLLNTIIYIMGVYGCGKTTIGTLLSELTGYSFFDGDQFHPSENMEKMAALVSAIAVGATIFSHVNDSGFWLVKQYLGLTEKQTFQSWSTMTLLLSIVAGALSIFFFYIG